MARPTKITPEMLQQIEELAAEGLSIPTIEAYIGVADGLLRRYWSKGNTQKGIGLQVFHAIKRGRARLERFLLSELHDVVSGKKRNPYWTLAARWLEALGVWETREKQKQDESAANVNKLVVKVVDGRKIEKDESD